MDRIIHNLDIKKELYAKSESYISMAIETRSQLSLGSKVNMAINQVPSRLLLSSSFDL